MRKALAFLVMLLSVTLCGQQATRQQAAYLPQRKATLRPRVSLQEALKIAEDYIAKQHIDIRPFWLYRAIYILQGDENTPDEKKLPGWHFWWVNENGALGDYVEIFVDMDGKAYRGPSM